MPMEPFAPFALIVPVFETPPPTELFCTKRATVVDPLKPNPAFPGVIVPAFVTAPVTVEPVITIEVVAWPAGLVTVATVVLVIACPACAGVAAPRRSAAIDVVARSQGPRPRLEGNEIMGMERTPAR